MKCYVKKEEFLCVVDVKHQTTAEAESNGNEMNFDDLVKWQKCVSIIIF